MEQEYDEEFEVLASQMTEEAENEQTVDDEADFDKIASQMVEELEVEAEENGAESARASMIQHGQENSWRFGRPIDDTEVEERASSSMPKNTRRQMEWATNVLNSWRAQRDLKDVPDPLKPSFKQPVNTLPAPHLLWILQRFVLEVRNGQGEHYSGDTLYQLCTSLQKAVNVDGSRNDLFFNSWEYKQFADVLDGELKRLRRTGAGLGTKPRQAAVLSEEEEEQLWSKGVFGGSNPKQLMDTIFFLCGKHFALRSGDEHRSLRLGRNANLAIHLDPISKRRYIEYEEDTAKNCQGGLRQRKVTVKRVRAYNNQGNRDRCFVTLFELYLSKRPSSAEGCPDALYLKPLLGKKSWCAKSPIGHNTLKGLFREICVRGGLTEPE